MTLAEVIDTLQTWIRNADDEYDREEVGRVAGLKEALHEIKKIEPCEECLSVIFPDCRYCIHHVLRCMPKDQVCGKCVRSDVGSLPSEYQQKEDK